MISKVEIASVNTSKLPVLTQKEKEELLVEIKNGNKEAREKFIKGNLRLVLSVIQRFGGRRENADDLFQVGCVGLIKAIDNFDITLNVQFSTYAVPMIIGEIRRHLRDTNSKRVSRSLRDTAYKAMQLKEQIINNKNREPTIEEIAEELGIPTENVVLSLESIVEPISLSEPVYADNNGDAVYMIDQIGDNIDDADWVDELCIKQAIKNLTDREKSILFLRFLKGKTQTEVATEIGISQAQVSRLEKNALKKIKE